jgi:hypothetical protein
LIAVSLDHGIFVALHVEGCKIEVPLDAALVAGFGGFKGGAVASGVACFGSSLPHGQYQLALAGGTSKPPQAVTKMKLQVPRKKGRIVIAPPNTDRRAGVARSFVSRNAETWATQQAEFCKNTASRPARFVASTAGEAGGSAGIWAVMSLNCRIRSRRMMATGNCPN